MPVFTGIRQTSSSRNSGSLTHRHCLSAVLSSSLHQGRTNPEFFCGTATHRVLGLAPNEKGTPGLGLPKQSGVLNKAPLSFSFLVSPHFTCAGKSRVPIGCVDERVQFPIQTCASNRDSASQQYPSLLLI